MRVLFFDAFAGLSGDMTVGALLGLGLPFEHLRQQLSLLPLPGYRISATPRQVHGISATKFDVHVADAHAHGPDQHRQEHDSAQHTHRPYAEIRRMIEDSALDATVKNGALKIFDELAEAEGRVHSVAPAGVEFHEVGAVDSIVDIVGTAVGMAWAQVECVYASTLPLGSGIVSSQHGPLPVPAPATAELLRGFRTRPGDGAGELITPTGAAILAALASRDPVPELRLERVGYGAGQRTLTDRPNLLRLVLGDTVADVGHDELTVIETNIDDSNPEFYEYVMDRLFEAGARDVYLTPVHMKKNRPGVLLSVVANGSDRARLSAIVLSETSAIGVRSYTVHRLTLHRDIQTVSTPYGEVRVKVAISPDAHMNFAPEYEDCKRVARARQVPIKTVYQAALAAAVASGRRQ